MMTSPYKTSNILVFSGLVPALLRVATFDVSWWANAFGLSPAAFDTLFFFLSVVGIVMVVTGMTIGLRAKQRGVAIPTRSTSQLLLETTGHILAYLWTGAHLIGALAVFLSLMLLTFDQVLGLPRNPIDVLPLLIMVGAVLLTVHGVGRLIAQRFKDQYASAELFVRSALGIGGVVAVLGAIPVVVAYSESSSIASDDLFQFLIVWFLAVIVYVLGLQCFPRIRWTRRKKTNTTLAV